MDLNYIRQDMRSRLSGFNGKLKKYTPEFITYIESSYLGESFNEKLYRFIYPEILNVCVGCGNLTKFKDSNRLKTGFNKYCSRSCQVQDKNANHNYDYDRLWKEATYTSEEAIKFSTNRFKDYIKSIYDGRSIRTKEPKFFRWLMNNQNIYGGEPLEKLYNYLYGNHKGKCITCGEDSRFIDPISGYSTYCSVLCSNSNEEKKQQVISTVVEKYGVDNICKVPKIKEKVKDTIKKHYGEDGRSNKIIKNRRIATCLNRYGVEHISQDPEIYARTQRSGFKMKEFIFPSGKVVLVRGYEDKAISSLLGLGYHEDDIEVRVKNMPFRIFYKNPNKQYKLSFYHPDIYIKSINHIVEVKSKYYYERYLDQNFAKQEQCKKQGLNFSFFVYHNDGSEYDIIGDPIGII